MDMTNTSTSTSTMDGSNTVHSPLFGPVVTPWVIFITIAVSLTFYRVSATSAFTTLGIVINQSVDKDMRGINTDLGHMLLSVLLLMLSYTVILLSHRLSSSVISRLRQKTLD
jgi:glucan phosphoethanolaminetransferase (alkaline phosphatase superfamily)